jgi:ADP-ribosylation factor-like protein 2
MSDLEISEASFLTIQRVSSDADESIQALDLPGIKSHNWKIWSCSAVTGLNLIQGLDWVVEDVAHRLYYSSTSFA